MQARIVTINVAETAKTVLAQRLASPIAFISGNIPITLELLKMQVIL